MDSSGRKGSRTENDASVVQTTGNAVNSLADSSLGGVSERLKEPVLKTGVRVSRTVGSNPTPTVCFIRAGEESNRNLKSEQFPRNVPYC